MEVNMIILSKNSDEDTLHLGIKRQIKKIFEKLYKNVDEESFIIELDGIEETIIYKLSSKSANMVFAKFICEKTPARASKIMDLIVNKLIQGEHRKQWNIVITYDEVSQLYCCKLMPLFGIFERRTRELVYITIIKTFGVDWYEKSFNQNLQNELKGKGNKTKLVEGALNELTYEQLKEYLFEPFSSLNLSEIIEYQLEKNKLEKLSKEEIVSILDNCRSISLWDRFFSQYKQFKDFHEHINRLQPYRNTVMHHKRLTQKEYEMVRRELNFANRKLKVAIGFLEEEMYTETKLTNVVSAIGKMLANVLGASVSQWVEQMKPSLASFGKLAIEAAIAKRYQYN